MPFAWNVQPYRFLNELQEHYTQTVILATRNSSERLAKQAKAWMKQNAPWTDKDIYRGRGENKVLVHKAGTARAGLMVFVRNPEGESKAYKAGMARATNQDAQLLDQMNRDVRNRRDKAKSRLGDLENSHQEAAFFEYRDEQKALGKLLPESKRGYLEGRLAEARADDASAPRRASRLRYNLKTQKQYKRVRNVPKGKSAVAAFKRGHLSQRTPVVSVVFAHDEDLSYPIWLEIARGGRFGIISKAIEHWTPKFMGEIRKIATLKQYRENLAISSALNPETTSPEDQFAAHVKQQRTYRRYESWSAEEQATKRRNKKYYKGAAYAAEAKRLISEYKPGPTLRTVDQKLEESKYTFFDLRKKK